LPDAYQPDAGYVVVAKQEALDLVAYLLALDRTYPILPAEDVVSKEKVGGIQ